jgi:hypothetical protein
MKPFLQALLLMLTAALTAALTAPAHAEQKRSIGAYDAHYSIVPTLFLKPEVAARHGIRRGRDRALLNVSVLDRSDTPVKAAVSGTVRNLLGQQLNLEFREVLDGTAVYYLAVVQHTNREVLRFVIDITTPDTAVHQLDLTQTLYWQER